MVALVTSLCPEELSAAQWLAYNRAAWGIESGLHQRLDVSHLDDLCRVRQPKVHVTFLQCTMSPVLVTFGLAGV
jgi:hypothetical protein